MFQRCCRSIWAAARKWEIVSIPGFEVSHVSQRLLPFRTPRWLMEIAKSPLLGRYSMIELPSWRFTECIPGEISEWCSKGVASYQWVTSTRLRLSKAGKPGFRVTCFFSFPPPLSLSLPFDTKKASRTPGYSKLSRMFSPLITKPSSNWHSLFLILCSFSDIQTPGCGSSDPNSSMGVYSPGMVQVQCWMSPVTDCFVQLHGKSMLCTAVLSLLKRLGCSQNKKVKWTGRGYGTTPGSQEYWLILVPIVCFFSSG